MERSTPVRKPHTSTADLLTWSEKPPAPLDRAAADSATQGSRRTNKPASGITPVMFGGAMSEEEAENVLKSARKPSSGYKVRERTGSSIFAADSENGTSESSVTANSKNRAGLRSYQQAVSGISQISFSADESVSPKKPATLTEVAKQRELCGTLENESDARPKKQQYEAKCKELSGHDIFGPPPEVTPRPLAAQNLELKGHMDFGETAPRSVHPYVKVPNPSGGPSNIMYGDAPEVKTATNKLMSVAKLREMSGSDMFSDGKASSRERYGGVRRPPGGQSSISLV